MLTQQLLPVPFAQDLRTNIPRLRADLRRLEFTLNLNPQVIELLVLAADNEWCPIATLHSAGQLQRMSSWQVYGLFNEVLKEYFSISVTAMIDTRGYAVIHRDNGNCLIADENGSISAQIISPLDIGFISYLANAQTNNLAALS
jgi:hypothetical protein